MVQKPEIQYVGQFYVYGSEAQELAPQKLGRKNRKNQLQTKPEQERMILVDPVALCGMMVAVVMLVTLVIGAVQISTTWKQYDAMERYLADLKQENAQLQDTYQASYDLTEIRSTALALGMIPAEEATVIAVDVRIPVPEPDPTWWEEITWFLNGLFE